LESTIEVNAKAGRSPFKIGHSDMKLASATLPGVQSLPL